MTHIPVLLEEIVKFLAPTPGDRIVDCTAGLGGHARAIAKRILPDGEVLAIDWDADSLANLQLSLNGETPRPAVRVAHGNFANLSDILAREKFGPVRGVLMDLGWSSWHVEGSGGGFTFTKDESLDMRFWRADAGQGGEETAADLVNRASAEELAEIFHELGEERHARRVAEAIVASRRRERVTRTKQLADIVANAVGGARGRMHPATKVFQALRIAVNGELTNVQKGMAAAVAALVPGGRLAVISFHSLEDRIVKQFLKSEAVAGRLALVTKKPVVPSREEVAHNPRSRSAKLRVAEKI